MVMPKKSKPNPRIDSPQPLAERLFESVMTNPIVIAGSARPERLNEMICAVTVVPMFAPKMMPIACVRFSSPALMNPITMTVVALDDWITAVTSVPASTATMPLRAKNCSTFFMFSPAIFWMPSPMSSMPKMKSASPPSTAITTERTLNPSSLTVLFWIRNPSSGFRTLIPML